MSAEADKATESAAPSFREGPPASLNLYDVRDMRLLNMKLRDWWEGSLSELHEWSEAIRDVRETTGDEKVLLAGGAVAATIARAFADSYAKRALWKCVHELRTIETQWTLDERRVHDVSLAAKEAAEMAHCAIETLVVCVARERELDEAVTERNRMIRELRDVVTGRSDARTDLLHCVELLLP